MKKNYKIYIALLILMIMAPISVFSCLVNKNAINGVNGAETLQIGTNNYLTKTSRDYWGIEDAQDFRDFVSYVNNNNGADDMQFELVNSINLRSSDDVIEVFNGWFYGGNHTISGISCFTKINGAKGRIYNLAVANGDMDFSDSTELEKRVASYSTSGVSKSANLDSTTYFSGAGIIASVNLGKIDYCGVYDSTVKISGSAVCAGAIAGVNAGNITNSYSYGNTISASGDQDAVAGGIAGYFCGDGNEILNCISASNDIRGLGIAFNKDLRWDNDESDYSAGGIVGGAVLGSKTLIVPDRYPTISGFSSIENCYGNNDLDYEMCPINIQFKTLLGLDQKIDDNDWLIFKDNYTGSNTADVLYEGNYSTSTYSYSFEVNGSREAETNRQIGAYYARKPGYFNASFGTVAPAGNYESWWTSGRYSASSDGAELQTWLTDCMYRLAEYSVNASSMLPIYTEAVFTGSVPHTLLYYFYEDENKNGRFDSGETQIFPFETESVKSFLTDKGYLTNNGNNYTFAFGDFSQTFSSSCIYYEEPVITDASKWHFPTSSGDHYGYPYFDEPMSIRLSYYDTAEDFREGTLTTVSVATENLFTSSGGAIEIINNAVKGAYDKNGVFKIISEYKLYESDKSSAKGSIYKVDTETGNFSSSNSDFKVSGGKLQTSSGTDLSAGSYIIKPTYIDLAPSISLEVNPHIPSGALTYSVSFADLISVTNGSVTGSETIDASSQPENTSVFNTQKSIKVEAKYTLNGEERATYVYAYLKIGRPVQQKEFLNGYDESETPISSNLSSHYGDYEQSWTAGTLNERYYKDLKLTLVVDIYVEMDIIAHTPNGSPAEYTYQVLYDTDCTFARSDTSFRGITVPTVNGQILGYFDGVNGTGTQVTDGQLNFVYSKYFTSNDDGEDAYIHTGTPLNIYASISTRTGTVKYTIDTTKVGGTLKSSTTIKLAVAVHMYFQLGTDYVTYEWYYKSGETGPNRLNDNEYYNFIKAGESVTVTVHYPDQADTTHWIQYGSDTMVINTDDTITDPYGRGNNLQLFKIEFKFQGYVDNPTMYAGYKFSTEEITSDNCSANVIVSSASDCEFGSISTREWEPDGDSNFEAWLAELQVAELYDPVWGPEDESKGKLYRVTGTTIKTDLGGDVPGSYGAGITDFMIENGTGDDEDIWLKRDSKGEWDYTEYYFKDYNDASVKLYAQYNPITIHYYESGFGNDYSATGWTTASGGYTYSLKQEMNMRIPGGIDFSPKDDEDKTFKGWYATSTPFSDGKTHATSANISSSNTNTLGLGATRIQRGWVGEDDNGKPHMYIYETWVDDSGSGGGSGDYSVSLTIYQRLDSASGELLGTVTKSLYYNKSGSTYVLSGATSVDAPTLSGYTFSAWGGYSAGFFNYSGGELSLKASVTTEPQDIRAIAIYVLENTAITISSFTVYYACFSGNTITDYNGWTHSYSSSSSQAYCIITSANQYLPDKSIPTTLTRAKRWSVNGTIYSSTSFASFNYWERFGPLNQSKIYISEQGDKNDDKMSQSTVTLTFSLPYLAGDYIASNAYYWDDDYSSMLGRCDLPELTITLDVLYVTTSYSYANSSVTGLGNTEITSGNTTTTTVYFLYDESYAYACGEPWDEKIELTHYDSDGNPQSSEKYTYKVVDFDLLKYLEANGWGFLKPYIKYSSQAPYSSIVSWAFCAPDGTGKVYATAENFLLKSKGEITIGSESSYYQYSDGTKSDTTTTPISIISGMSSKIVSDQKLMSTIQFTCLIESSAATFNVRLGGTGVILKSYTYYSGLKKLTEYTVDGINLLNYLFGDDAITEGAIINGETDYIVKFENDHGVFFNKFDGVDRKVRELSADQQQITFIPITFSPTTYEYWNCKGKAPADWWDKYVRKNTDYWSIKSNYTVDDILVDFVGAGTATIYFGVQDGFDDSTREIKFDHSYLFQYAIPYTFNGVTHTKYSYDALNGFVSTQDLDHDYVSYGFNLADTTYFKNLASQYLRERGSISVYYSYDHDGTNLKDGSSLLNYYYSDDWWEPDEDEDDDDDSYSGYVPLTYINLLSKNYTLAAMAEYELSGDYCIYIILEVGTQIRSNITIDFVSNSMYNIDEYNQPLAIYDGESSTTVGFSPFNEDYFYYAVWDEDAYNEEDDSEGAYIYYYANNINVPRDSNSRYGEYIVELVMGENYYKDWFTLCYDENGNAIIKLNRAQVLNYINAGGEIKNMQLSVRYCITGLYYSYNGNVTSHDYKIAYTAYIPKNCVLTITRLLGTRKETTTIKVVNYKLYQLVDGTWTQISGAYYELTDMYVDVNDKIDGYYSYNTLNEPQYRSLSLGFTNYYSGDVYGELTFYGPHYNSETGGYDTSGYYYDEYNLYTGGLFYVTALEEENYALINVDYEGVSFEYAKDWQADHETIQGGALTFYYTKTGGGYNFDENYNKGMETVYYDYGGEDETSYKTTFIGWKIKLLEGDSDSYLKLFDLSGLSYDESTGCYKGNYSGDYDDSYSSKALKTCISPIEGLTGAFKIQLTAVYEIQENCAYVTIVYKDYDGNVITAADNGEAIEGRTEKWDTSRDNTSHEVSEPGIYGYQCVRAEFDVISGYNGSIDEIVTDKYTGCSTVKVGMRGGSGGTSYATLTFIYNKVDIRKLTVEYYYGDVTVPSESNTYSIAANYTYDKNSETKVYGVGYCDGQRLTIFNVSKTYKNVKYIYYDRSSTDNWLSIKLGETKEYYLVNINIPSKNSNKECVYRLYYGEESKVTGSNLILEIVKHYEDGSEEVCETVERSYKAPSNYYVGSRVTGWTFAGYSYNGINPSAIVNYNGFVKWELTTTYANASVDESTYVPIKIDETGGIIYLDYLPTYYSGYGEITVKAVAYINRYKVEISCLNNKTGTSILTQTDMFDRSGETYNPYDVYNNGSGSGSGADDDDENEAVVEEDFNYYEYDYTPLTIDGYEFVKWGDVTVVPSNWELTFLDESGNVSTTEKSGLHLKIGPETSSSTENRDFAISAYYDSKDSIVIQVDYLNDNGQTIADVKGGTIESDIYEYFYAYAGQDKPASEYYVSKILGENIEYKEIWGHSTIIGWIIPEQYLFIFGLTTNDVKESGYVTQNMLTLADVNDLSVFSGEKKFSITAIMRPDVANIEVVSLNDLGEEMGRDYYKFYYKSEYTTGSSNEFNVSNVGDSLPTRSDLGVFDHYDRLQFSSNWNKFFNDSLCLTANSSVCGVHNITLYAIYETNVATFITRFSTDNGLTYSNEISYTFYYKNAGVNGTLNHKDYFNYEVNETDYNQPIYLFDAYNVEVTEGDSYYAEYLYSIDGEALSATGWLSSLKGRYEIIFTAKYVELTVAVVNIEYKDKNRPASDSALQTEQYLFYYANNKPQFTANNYEIGNNEDITVSELTGFTFTELVIPDSAKPFFKEYTSGDTITTCEERPEGATGYYNFTINAYYESASYIIKIDYVDENGEKINADVTSLYYYYNGTLASITDKVEPGYEYTAPAVIAYVFKEWTTENDTYGYVEFSGDKLTVKDSSETLPSAIYTLTVHCVYKSTADLYIQVNVNNYHWEEKEYNGNLVSIGETEAIKFYYHEKQSYGENEYGPSYYIFADSIDDYVFKFFEATDFTVEVSGETITLASLYDLKSFTYFNKDLIDGAEIDAIRRNPSAYKVTGNFYTSCAFSDVNELYRYYTILDQYLLENGSGALTLNINAYHSKAILLKGGPGNSTLSQTYTVPITYIINNDNFAGVLFANGTRPENMTFEYDVSVKVEYSFDTTAEFYSDETYVTNSGENYKLEKILSCDYSKPILDESFDPSATSLYNFLNGANLASYIPYGFSYDGGWDFVIAPSNGSEGNINLQNELISKITPLVDESALPNAINVHTPQVLYIQWKANTNTVHCITPIGQFDLTFKSASGSVGEIVYDFDQAMRDNVSFDVTMRTYYGQYSTSWKVSSLGENSCYYNLSGSAVESGDLLDYIYKNSYGEIYLELVITDYVKSMIEFNYGLSDRIYTDGNIYSQATNVYQKSGSKIAYYVDSNITYASIVNLNDLLDALYQDPNPVYVEYGDNVFYLAGWTFNETYFNPETWNSIDLNVYKTIVNANNANCAYFKRIISGKNNTLYTNSNNPIISYDGTLNYLYGNKTETINGVANVAVIPLYAVWMPYYELNLHTNNLDSTISGDMYKGATNLNEAGTAYTHVIHYGRTLQNSLDMNLSYDVLTLVGEAPTVTGLNIGKEGYFLQGYNILGNSDYGYAENWSTNKTTPYNALARSGNLSYVDFSGIYKSFVNYLKGRASFNGLGMKIDVYPIWEVGTIDVTVALGSISHYNGDYSPVTTSVPLIGAYCLDTYFDNDNVLKTKYSVKDIIETNSETIVPICGVSFNYRLYINNINTAIAEINGVERCILKLDCKANYAGNIYFLRIYGIDNLDDTVTQEITASMANGDVKTLDEFKQYYIQVGTERTSSEQAVSKVNVMSMYTYPAYSGGSYSYIDSSEMYASIKNNILEYGGALYLCLAYGDDVEYTTDGHDGETKLQTLKKGVTDLGYYAYFGTQNDTVYCYDTKNGTGLIKKSGINKVLSNYTGTKNPTCEIYWVPNGDIYQYSIAAVWDLRQYDIDLSVQLEELGTTADTNSGYLVAEVRYDDPKLPNSYYILNYEKDGLNYEYNLYELTESEYARATRYYNGWNTLGVTPTKSNKITVYAGAVVSIKAFDQSKDSDNDCMIGYRLERTEVTNPEETEPTKIDVAQNDWVTWTDGTQYINVNGYTSELDFTTVALPDKSVISYKVILTKIAYKLKVFTDDGLLSITYKYVEYRNKESYEFTTLNIGDSIGVQYYPYLGYELDAWRLNTNDNFSDQYYIGCEFDATFLRNYVYSSGVYSASKEQDVGELEAIAKLIEFNIKIVMWDRNSAETIVTVDLPNNSAILSVTENRARAIGGLSSISLGGDYIMSIVHANLSKNLKSNENIYLSYLSDDGKYYALLSMYVKGKVNNYSNVNFDFPTENFADMSLSLTTQTLEDLVTFTIGEPVAEQNRFITVRIECAKIFKVGASEISSPTEDDLKKGTRSLIGGVYSTILATGSDNNNILNTNDVAYAYENQEVELKISAPTNYYIGARLSSTELDMEETLALSDSLRFSITQNTYWDVVFVTKTYECEVIINYREKDYHLTEYNDVKNVGGENVIKVSPTVEIKSADEKTTRLSTYYYSDIVFLTFNDGWIDSANYGYTVIVNGSLRNDRAYEITQDMQVTINIFDLESSVIVYKNISESAEVIVKSTTQEAKTIDGASTVGFNMVAGEALTAYIKLNAGYVFENVTHINGTTETLSRGQSIVTEGTYAGYTMISLIDSFNSEMGGQYILNFEELRYEVEFVYYAHNTEINNPGGEYTATTNKVGQVTFTMKESVTISNNGKISDGYRFIGYTIGGTAEEGQQPIESGKEKNVDVKLSDYSEIISNDGKLIIYVNFIYQHKIYVNVRDNFGQTKIRVNSGTEDPPVNTQCLTIDVAGGYSTKYYDETIYSGERYILKAESRDIEHYYVRIWLVDDGNKIALKSGDEGVEVANIAGTPYLNRIYYTFDLDKDYTFEIEYMPRDYAVKLGEYYYDSMGQFDDAETAKINGIEIQVTELDKNLSIKETEQIEITVSAVDPSLLNCYDTTLNVVIKINLNEATKQYKFDKLTIDGVELVGSETEDGDWLTISFEIKIESDTTINVHYKQVYIVNVDCGQA